LSSLPLLLLLLVCICMCMQGSRNVLYLCEQLVSEACLAEKQPDACVNELIDAALAQKSSSAKGLSGAVLAAVIVPIVVVGKQQLCKSCVQAYRSANQGHG
jgi:hypothetical protein